MPFFNVAIIRQIIQDETAVIEDIEAESLDEAIAKAAVMIQADDFEYDPESTNVFDSEFGPWEIDEDSTATEEVP